MTVLQTLEHKVLGSIAYDWPRLWLLHYDLAMSAHAELMALHQKFAEHEVSKAGFRMLGDSDAQEFFDPGVRMVVHSVLSVQQLATEIESVFNLEQAGNDAATRISSAVDLSDLDALQSTIGIRELIEVRDAIEHPKQENVYSMDSWSQVPLAWMMSDRPEVAFGRFQTEIGGVAANLHEHRAANRNPAVLDVKRGMRSNRQFKKPPRAT